MKHSAKSKNTIMITILLLSLISTAQATQTWTTIQTGSDNYDSFKPSSAVSDEGKLAFTYTHITEETIMPNTHINVEAKCENQEIKTYPKESALGIIDYMRQKILEKNKDLSESIHNLAEYYNSEYEDKSDLMPQSVKDNQELATKLDQDEINKVYKAVGQYMMENILKEKGAKISLITAMAETTAIQFEIDRRQIYSLEELNKTILESRNEILNMGEFNEYIDKLLLAISNIKESDITGVITKMPMISTG